jgi:hypothetical protein
MRKLRWFFVASRFAVFCSKPRPHFGQDLKKAMETGLRRHAWGLVVCLWVFSGCRPPEMGHALARREIALERLGEVIRKSESGGEVLVIGNPFSQRPGVSRDIRDAERAAVRGLRRGLGDSAVLREVFPELKPGALEAPETFSIPPGATTPVSFLVAPGAWDDLRRQYPDAKVLVSLIGLPVDLEGTSCWKDTNGPRWALFLPDLRFMGEPGAVKEAFERGRLLAVVLNRIGAPPESVPILDSADEDFARHHLLLTRDNVDALMEAWPKLYPANPGRAM